MSNAKLDRATALLLIAIICGVVFALNFNKPGEFQRKAVDAITAGEDEAQIDEYQKQEQEAIWINIISGFGCLVSGVLALIWGAEGLRQRSSEHEVTRFEIEEERHQELLAAIRQVETPSIAARSNGPDHYFMEAERLYRAGKLDEAIALLEQSEWPKAKTVLKNLREIQKSKKAK